MFEAYRIRPVVEWEGTDESREIRAFNTLEEALVAQARLIAADPQANVEPRLFWSLYGVNPEVGGVRTEDTISDLVSEVAAIELLAKILGSFRGTGSVGYFVAAASRIPETEVSKSFKVRMVWGLGEGGDARSVKDYEFSTRAELDAFLEGCEEANGWLGMEQIDPGPDGTFRNPSDGR